MNLTDGEVRHLRELLLDEADKMGHHPGDFTEEENDAHDSLSKKVYDEAKQRKFWWAR